MASAAASEPDAAEVGRKRTLSQLHQRFHLALDDNDGVAGDAVHHRNPTAADDDTLGYTDESPTPLSYSPLPRRPA